MAAWVGEIRAAQLEWRFRVRNPQDGGLSFADDEERERERERVCVCVKRWDNATLQWSSLTMLSSGHPNQATFNI